MEWVNETCDECKKDCLLIHGKRVPSFSKAMTDKSCLQVLELPESWQDLLEKPTRGRWIIFLRGLDKRIWPVFYHSRSGVDVLTCGWEKVAAAYGMNAEDDCLFQLADQQKHIFDICKI